MQKLVEKYKPDPNVAFLFVNAMEMKSQEKTEEAVTNYITESKFNFNVIYDFDGKVKENYQVNGIPA